MLHGTKVFQIAPYFSVLSIIYHLLSIMELSMKAISHLFKPYKGFKLLANMMLAGSYNGQVKIPATLLTALFVSCGHFVDTNFLCRHIGVLHFMLCFTGYESCRGLGCSC